MTTFITYTLLGLVVGAVYAIAASGLVLTYTTSGIFNFAHGAQAMLGAFLYWQFKYGWGWPTWLAVVVDVLIVGPLMGWLLYNGIMRRLAGTAEVTRIIVTVSLLLGMVYLSQWIWHPDEPRTVQMFFGPNSKWDVLGITSIRTHELIALAAGGLIAVGLRLMFTRTRLGVAMRATVDNPDLLRLNGFTPERVASISWALGSMLAVLAGVLITPIGGGALEANALTLLVIDAFAAAMFGRLKSIVGTFIGAILLGLGATYLIAYLPASTFTSNLRVALPMIVLFILLIVLPPARLEATGSRTRERTLTPTVRSAVIWGGILILVVGLLRLLMVDQAVTTLTVGMGFAIVALSLVLATGYGGEMNLAAMSFGAVAVLIAYHVGRTGEGLAQSMTWWGVLAGVAAAALVGAAVALPALKMRGLYLALATMAFGVMLSTLVLRDTTPHTIFGWTFTILPGGNLAVPPLKIGPLDLRDHTTALMFSTIVFVLLSIGLVALRNSGFGRRLSAMKDSPAASAMLGENLLGVKLFVFVVSAAIAGLGAVLMAGTLGSVDATNFQIMGSLALLMLVVVNGVAYVSGGLAGGLFSGVGVAILVVTFNDLSASASGGLTDIYKFIANLIHLLPALIGLSVGSNPSGSVHEQVLKYRPLRKTPQIVAGAVGVIIVLYVLALTDIISNWAFALLTILVLILLPRVAQALKPAAFGISTERSLPLELEGVTRPYSEDLRHKIDEELGLPTYSSERLPLHGTA